MREEIVGGDNPIIDYTNKTSIPSIKAILPTLYRFSCVNQVRCTSEVRRTSKCTN